MTDRQTETERNRQTHREEEGGCVYTERERSDGHLSKKNLVPQDKGLVFMLHYAQCVLISLRHTGLSIASRHGWSRHRKRPTIPPPPPPPPPPSRPRLNESLRSPNVKTELPAYDFFLLANASPMSTGASGHPRERLLSNFEGTVGLSRTEKRRVAGRFGGVGGGEECVCLFNAKIYFLSVNRQ